MSEKKKETCSHLYFRTLGGTVTIRLVLLPFLLFLLLLLLLVMVSAPAGTPPAGFLCQLVQRGEMVRSENRAQLAAATIAAVSPYSARDVRKLKTKSVSLGASSFGNQGRMFLAWNENFSSQSSKLSWGLTDPSRRCAMVALGELQEMETAHHRSSWMKVGLRRIGEFGTRNEHNRISSVRRGRMNVQTFGPGPNQDARDNSPIFHRGSE